MICKPCRKAGEALSRGLTADAQLHHLGCVTLYPVLRGPSWCDCQHDTKPGMVKRG